MIPYLIALPVCLALLAVVKLLEGSPIRSWKVALPTGALLGLAVGYYFNHALPPKAVPLAQVQKASAYKAELERTFRRVDGVESASIEGSLVTMDFGADKPLAELKTIAARCGATAAYFLQTDKKGNQVTVHITVRGRDRYEMEFNTQGGVSNEKVFD